MQIVGVIPARYSSSRFPGKVLAELGGKPIIQWVYEGAKRAKKIAAVYVATDDERIARAVSAFGGQALMTSRDCASGTDRIAQAISALEADIIVNVQGDEPLIAPETIDATIDGLLNSLECQVSTPAVAITDEGQFNSPHVVKVVFDQNGIALYFSRSPIPSLSRRDCLKETTTQIESEKSLYARVFGYKHLGLYVYRREALVNFRRMPPSPLEQIEKLEQLRFLENGMKIKVVITESDSPGIDTPEELAALRKKLNL